MAKKMIIKGVGTFMAKRPVANGGTEVLTLGHLQDLKITFTVEIEDIFGGDGLFAIDTLVKSKAIEITATDAKFDLDAVSLMLGSTVREGVTSGDADAYVWVLNEQRTIATGTNGTASCGVITPEFSTTLFSTPEFAVRLMVGNKLLAMETFAADTIPTSGKFMFDATAKKLYFDDADVGKDVAFNYKRTETVDVTAVLVDEIPFPVSVVHHGSFQQKDGDFAGIETELFSCRAKGTFSIDAARATASAMNVALQVIDPERADGRMGTIKRYSSPTRV